MNVGGLALSITLSSALSSAIILFYYGFKKHFNFLEVLSISAIWFIFCATLIGVNFDTFLMLLEKLM